MAITVVHFKGMVRIFTLIYVNYMTVTYFRNEDYSPFNLFVSIKEALFCRIWKATIPQVKVGYFPLHAIELKCIPTQQITHSSGRRTNMGGHNCNAISLEQLIHLCCLSPLWPPEHYSTCGAPVSGYILYVRMDGYILHG